MIICAFYPNNLSIFFPWVIVLQSKQNCYFVHHLLIPICRDYQLLFPIEKSMNMNFTTFAVAYHHTWIWLPVRDSRFSILRKRTNNKKNVKERDKYTAHESIVKNSAHLSSSLSSKTGQTHWSSGAAAPLLLKGLPKGRKRSKAGCVLFWGNAQMWNWPDGDWLGLQVGRKDVECSWRVFFVQHRHKVCRWKNQPSIFFALIFAISLPFFEIFGTDVQFWSLAPIFRIDP